MPTVDSFLPDIIYYTNNFFLWIHCFQYNSLYTNFSDFHIGHYQNVQEAGD